MEENNNMNEEKLIHEHSECHCKKTGIAMIIAAFLGGFLAIYFVADQIMERKLNSVSFAPDRFEQKMLNDMDRMYRQDMRAFDDMFKKMPQPKMHKPKHKDLMFPPMFMTDDVKIKSDFEDNHFNITIGLKPFQDDENKVNYNVNGRKLTVFGNSHVKDKGYEEDIAFSQDFILPENSDIANISKIKDGNKLILSVPMK